VGAVLFLIDTREQPPKREPPRLPKWLAAVVLLFVVGVVTGGVIGVICLFTAVVVIIDRALPSVTNGGLRDYHQ
jgi:hypothetical protein